MGLKWKIIHTSQIHSSWMMNNATKSWYKTLGHMHPIYKLSEISCPVIRESLIWATLLQGSSSTHSRENGNAGHDYKSRRLHQ